MYYTMIESVYGHQFTSTDNPSHDACLTCGAMYEIVPRDSTLRPADDEEVNDWLSGYTNIPGAVETEDGLMMPEDSTGKYVAANGDTPRECTGNTDMTHGYEEASDPECNCLFCA